MAGGAQPGGAVHVESDIARVHVDRLARVETHPDGHCHVMGPCVLGQLSLGRHRGKERVPGRWKRDVQAVAGAVDLRAAHRGEGITQKAVVIGENRRVCPAEALQEAGRSLDVGEQEGDGRSRGRAFGSLPRDGLIAQGRRLGFLSWVVGGRDGVQSTSRLSIRFGAVSLLRGLLRPVWLCHVLRVEAGRRFDVTVGSSVVRCRPTHEET